METQVKLFKYQRPEFEGVKNTMLMCNSDLMKVQVQVVKSGGENNLHTHTGEDAFWLVLKGAVKFYGEGDKEFPKNFRGQYTSFPFLPFCRPLFLRRKLVPITCSRGQ